MPYQAAFDDQKAIVRVRVFGSVPHKEHEEARLAAARLCREHDCKRLLVDLRDLITDKDVSTISCFDFGSEYKNVILPAATRSALVMPIDSKAFQDVDFTTTVALNRGVIIRNFQTVKEAEEWLFEYEQ